MNTLQILLRIVHIVGGIFWVGSVMFTAIFLLPALKDAGPDGAKVMQGIAQRKFMVITPIVALFTILSGLWMFARNTDGFKPAFFSARPVMAFSTGGGLAIAAFLIGIMTVRPWMTKVAQLSQSAASASPEEKAKIMAQVGALRARAGTMGNVVATMLVLAATAMAVARYL